MRRHRQVRYPLAFLTVAVGIAAVPAVVTAAADGTDPAPPADGTTRAAQPPAPTPAPPAEEKPAPAPPTTHHPKPRSPGEPQPHL